MISGLVLFAMHQTAALTIVVAIFLRRAHRDAQAREEIRLTAPLPPERWDIAGEMTPLDLPGIGDTAVLAAVPLAPRSARPYVPLARVSSPRLRFTRTETDPIPAGTCPIFDELVAQWPAWLESRERAVRTPTQEFELIVAGADWSPDWELVGA